MSLCSFHLRPHLGLFSLFALLFFRPSRGRFLSSLLLLLLHLQQRFTVHLRSPIVATLPSFLPSRLRINSQPNRSLEWDHETVLFLDRHGVCVFLQRVPSLLAQTGFQVIAKKTLMLQGNSEVGDQRQDVESPPHRQRRHDRRATTSSTILLRVKRCRSPTARDESTDESDQRGGFILTFPAESRIFDVLPNSSSMVARGDTADCADDVVIVSFEPVRGESGQPPLHAATTDASSVPQPKRLVADTTDTSIALLSKCVAGMRLADDDDRTLAARDPVLQAVRLSAASGGGTDITTTPIRSAAGHDDGSVKATTTTKTTGTGRCAEVPSKRFQSRYEARTAAVSHSTAQGGCPSAPPRLHCTQVSVSKSGHLCLVDATDEERTSTGGGAASSPAALPSLTATAPPKDQQEVVWYREVKRQRVRGHLHGKRDRMERDGMRESAAGLLDTSALAKPVPTMAEKGHTDPHHDDDDGGGLLDAQHAGQGYLATSPYMVLPDPASWRWETDLPEEIESLLCTGTFVPPDHLVTEFDDRADVSESAAHRWLHSATRYSKAVARCGFEGASDADDGRSSSTTEDHGDIAPPPDVPVDGDSDDVDSWGVSRRVDVEVGDRRSLHKQKKKTAADGSTAARKLSTDDGGRRDGRKNNEAAAAGADDDDDGAMISTFAPAYWGDDYDENAEDAIDGYGDSSSTSTPETRTTTSPAASLEDGGDEEGTDGHSPSDRQLDIGSENDDDDYERHVDDIFGDSDATTLGTGPGIVRPPSSHHFGPRVDCGGVGADVSQQLRRGGHDVPVSGDGSSSSTAAAPPAADSSIGTSRFRALWDALEAAAADHTVAPESAARGNWSEAAPAGRVHDEQQFPLFSQRGDKKRITETHRAVPSHRAASHLVFDDEGNAYW